VVMEGELEGFVASLAIPADRKAVVLAELADHVACAREAALRDGRDVEVAARDALGNLEALRRALEAIEPGFQISRGMAATRGLVAAGMIAVVIDLGGPLMTGILGWLVAIALAAVCAPPRTLDLLRAELRAAPRRGRVLTDVPIGPALTYAFVVTIVPFAVWITEIGVRAVVAGRTTVDVPTSAFAAVSAVWSVLVVERVRARRARKPA